MNTVALTGRLTKDPELKTTQTGRSVVSFNVAVQRNFKQDGKYRADFVGCVAWGSTAEFVAKYFGKGKPIEINGSIQTRTYDDQQGVRRYVTEVLISNVGFVQGGGKNTENGTPDATGEGEYDNAQGDPDNIFAQDLEPFELGDAPDLPF